MISFADTLHLDPAGDNLWRGEVDPAYKGFGSQFGGWTAAALLKGVMVEPETNGDPLSLTGVADALPAGATVVMIGPWVIYTAPAVEAGGGRNISIQNRGETTERYV